MVLGKAEIHRLRDNHVVFALLVISSVNVEFFKYNRSNSLDFFPFWFIHHFLSNQYHYLQNILGILTLKVRNEIINIITSK